MKTVSVALAAHLAQGQTTLAYLWKVKRLDGTILGFTTHDRDLAYDAGDGDGSITYLARTGFTNTATANKSDLSVDNMEVTAFLNSDAISERDLRGKLYDNADVKILVVNWADLSMGHLYWRRGTLGIVKMVNGLFTVELRGLTNKLTAQLGATFGPLCRAEFGSGLNGIDLGSKYLCNVDVVALQASGTVISSPDARTINPAPVPIGLSPDGTFDDGFIKFTSGDLSGLSFEIKSFAAGLIKLFLPMPWAPHFGDTILVEPGCNKTIFDCKNKYDNVVNFRGEPFIPGNDAILNYPNAH